MNAMKLANNQTLLGEEDDEEFFLFGRGDDPFWNGILLQKS
jgi:hypothetical protein